MSDEAGSPPDSDSFDWPDIEWGDTDPLDAEKPKLRPSQLQKEHRAKYWNIEDYESYTCPDCGKPLEEAGRFDVHHKDGNPRNGDLDNLVGLCYPCHKRRHRRKNIEGRLERMKAEADELGK